jgi:hypothetical protein
MEYAKILYIMQYPKFLYIMQYPKFPSEFLELFITRLLPSFTVYGV